MIAGAAILDALMEDLGLTEIQAVAECGLREGLVVDDLARAGQHELTYGAGVRERSVLQLARAPPFDEAHARQVARLALELFDSAGAARLHRLGPEEREMLEYAALLHDVGTFLSYSDHHLHSYYLIRHADLLGFDENEIATMAATALFHRKALPAPRFEAFSGLDRPLAQGRAAARRPAAARRVPRPRARGRRRARRPAPGPAASSSSSSRPSDWSLECGGRDGGATASRRRSGAPSPWARSPSG